MLPARCAFHGLFVCFACLSRLANTYFSLLTDLSGIFGFCIHLGVFIIFMSYIFLYQTNNFIDIFQKVTLTKKTGSKKIRTVLSRRCRTTTTATTTNSLTARLSTFSLKKYRYKERIHNYIYFYNAFLWCRINCK